MGGTQVAQSFDVSGGATGLGVAGLGSVSVTGFSIGRQLQITGSGSTGVGDLFWLTLTGITAHLGGGGATLDLSGDGLDVRSFVTAPASYLYAGGSSLSLSAALGPVGASTTGVSFLYNPSTVTDWSFAAVTGTEVAQSFDVSGGGAVLGVSGLGFVHVTGFSIGRQLRITGSGWTGVGDLFWLTLTGITARLGGGSATLDVSGGQFDVRSFVAARANYVYAAGWTFWLCAALGPVTGSTTGVSFLYNPSTVTDWSFAGITGRQVAQRFDVSGGWTDLGVTGLGSVHVSTFSIGRQLQITCSGSGGVGDLYSLTLTGITAHLGGANATLDLTGGQLDVQSFVVSPSVSYVYAAGSDFGADGRPWPGLGVDDGSCRSSTTRRRSRTGRSPGSPARSRRRPSMSLVARPTSV